VSGGAEPIAIVILAAGASRRMGVAKQLLQVRGRSLFRHVADAALGSSCRPVIAVLGANAEAVQAEVEGLPVQVVWNAHWSEGLSTSIRAGIEALVAHSPEAVVLTLCDQPFVGSDSIEALVAAYRSTKRAIVASDYGGTLGVPALFSRAVFPELMALSGNTGAKQVIQRHAASVWSVPCPQGAMDVDTPEDYDTLRPRTTP
jgi:molybdenum cofactor cytidylyltransferase